MSQKKYRLSNLSLNEVSLVASGDDPEAHVMIFKAAPEGQTMMVQEPIGVMDTRGLKYYKQMKKKKDLMEYRKAALRRVEQMRRDYEATQHTEDDGHDHTHSVGKARDGDGDGFIHDGTPRQRPAPKRPKGRPDSSTTRRRSDPRLSRLPIGDETPEEARERIARIVERARERGIGTRSNKGGAERPKRTRPRIPVPDTGSDRKGERKRPAIPNEKRIQEVRAAINMLLANRNGRALTDDESKRLDELEAHLKFLQRKGD